ncbi:MAG: PmoA family protein, partial [Aureliella sp.]
MFTSTADNLRWCRTALLTYGLIGGGWLGELTAQDATEFSGIARCQVVPLADHQVAFTIDGVEKVRWHYGAQYPRPFFFPFNGPSGEMLTRMGHPGAPDHDHHQSIWFAHNKINGLDFWGNTSHTQIRQKQWLCYQDGPREATMATILGWYDSSGAEIMEQELTASLLPILAVEDGGVEEHGLELQFTLRPAAGLEAVEIEQTNFGFLAVRVAKSISASFGGGQLSNSEGAVSESECFGKTAKWMDYSGPVAVGVGSERTNVREGITFFDHPQNLRHPTHWHVRQDGWMGAAFGLQTGAEVTHEQPLTLRYLLYAHSGAY